MALDKRTLRRLRRQRQRLDRVLDAQDAALVDAWVRAWEELAAHVGRAAAASVSATGGAERVLRARRAMRIITAKLEQLTARLNVTVGRRVRRILESALADQDELISSQLPTGLHAQFGRVDARAIDAMVQRTTGQIEARSRALSASMVEQMRGELVRSVAVGINPRVAARQIVNRCQGVFDGGLARATVIARTETLDAYRASAQQAHKAAADVLQGWMWISALGPRTCPSCWAQHGSVHDLDEPGPQDHHQGRCTRAPVTKSWQDLGFKGIYEPASAVPDGQIEFGRLSEAQQREILGPKRFEAWQQGRYPMTDWSKRVSNGDWRDSHVTSPAPGGGAGGGQPPRRGSGPFKAMGEPPSESDKAAWNAYWLERQNALPLNFHGDTIGAHEVQSYERLLRAGEGISPIWNDPSRPTSDFDWLTRNVSNVELKTSRNPLREIERAAMRAVNHQWAPTTKEHFLIDIETDPLTDELRDLFAGYNAGRRKYRISRLWVMHTDGLIEEIALLP